MCKKETFYFDSAARGKRIRAVRHIPSGEVRAILGIAHGMVEHIDRYDDFAAYLAERGILVVGADHLGHGLSAETESDLGYFDREAGGDAVLADVIRLGELARAEYPGVPYFQLGHSMGSFFVRRLLSVAPEGLSGAVIMGTGCQSRALVRAGLALSRLIALFRGDRHRSKFVDRLAFGGYNRAFEPSRTPRDWLSRDPEAVDRYEADPRCGFLFTLNAYIGMFRTIDSLYPRRSLERMPRELPVLFVSGDADPVGECGRGVRRAYEAFRRVGMRSLALKLYPGARHEILNETNRAEVYKDVYDWIMERVK